MVTVADTAFSIAVVRAEESDKPEAERLFEDPYAALFAAAGGHAAEATQRFLELPGFREAVRLRTRYIDDAVRAGLAAGLRQIVLLGAGFDARGLRMPEVAACGATVFEVDTAGQLERKRAILAKAGIAIPPALTYTACEFLEDFEESLSAALAARGFRAGAGAIVVWEGVIGYIDQPAMDRTLRFVVRTCGPGTRLVFTFNDAAFDPETATERTRRMGFASCEETGIDEMWRRHLGEPPPYAFVSRLGTAIV